MATKSKLDLTKDEALKKVKNKSPFPASQKPYKIGGLAPGFKPDFSGSKFDLAKQAVQKKSLTLNAAAQNVSRAGKPPEQMEAERMAEEDRRLQQEGIAEEPLADVAEEGYKRGLWSALDDPKDRPPTTIDEVVERFKEKQAEEKKLSEVGYKRDMDIFDLQMARAEGQSASQQAGVREMFSQGREGAVSGTAPAAASRYSQELSRNLQETRMRISAARADRDASQKRFEEAQKAGKTELASQIKKQMFAAERQIRIEETNEMNALAQMSQEGRMVSQENRAVQAAQRQSLESFTNMVNQGTQMTTEGLLEMSKTLNIPFELANDYYKGAEAIRESKQLSVEEKQVKLDDLKYNFGLEKQGYVTQQAKQIKGVTDLLASGAITDEQAQDLLMGLGIDSSMNPLTQIKAAMSAADLKAKQIGLQYLPKEKQLAIQRGEQQLRLGDYDEMIMRAKAAGAEQSVIFDLEQARLDVRKAQYEDNKLHGVDQGITTGQFDQKVPKINKKVNSSLGAGLTTAYGSKYWKPGLDFVLEGGKGAPVAMPFGFEVVAVRPSKQTGGFGNQVKIKNSQDGQEVWISHLDGFGNVEKGQQYPPGTVIGTQGNTGRTIGKTGVHLDITMPKTEGGYYSAQQVASYFGMGKEGTAKTDARGVDQAAIASLDSKELTSIRTVSGQFTNEPIVKNYNEVANKFESINRIIEQGVGGPGDLALVFEFMKSLDPTSVVRESEYEAAAKSGNIFTGKMAQFNGYLKEEGGFLPDQVKDSFRDITQTKFDIATAQYDNLYQQYEKKINNFAGGKDVASGFIIDYKRQPEGESKEFSGYEQDLNKSLRMAEGVARVF